MSLHANLGRDEGNAIALTGKRVNSVHGICKTDIPKLASFLLTQMHFFSNENGLVGESSIVGHDIEDNVCVLLNNALKSVLGNAIAEDHKNHCFYIANARSLLCFKAEGDNDIDRALPMGLILERIQQGSVMNASISRKEVIGDLGKTLANIDKHINNVRAVNSNEKLAGISR